MPSTQSRDIHQQSHKRHRLRTHRRFRLSFINENTFNEVWTIRMSQRKVIAAVALMFVAIGCMAATLIVLTPLRTLLPGYLRQTERQEIAIKVLHVDSILTSAQATSSYLSNIASLLRGDSTTSTLISYQQQEHAIDPDSLIKASEREVALRNQVDERRRYTIDTNTPPAKSIHIFHNPIAGAEPQPSSTPHRLILRAPNNASVISPAPATVISVSYSPADLWSVVLQHPNGYLTYINGIEKVSALRGERLLSGETIGSTASSSLISIELWSAGAQLEPSRFMPI